MPGSTIRFFSAIQQRLLSAEWGEHIHRPFEARVRYAWESLLRFWLGRELRDAERRDARLLSLGRSEGQSLRLTLDAPSQDRGWPRCGPVLRRPKIAPRFDAAGILLEIGQASLEALNSREIIATTKAELG